MPRQLSIIQGAPASWQLQGRNRDLTIPTVFLDSDTLDAFLWRGQDQATLFHPAVSWVTSATCVFQLSISELQSASLELSGVYLILVEATRAGTAWPIGLVELTVLPGPGSAAQTIAPYCTYQDMLSIAPWVELVRQSDIDQQGFYTQRVMAREWMDSAIEASYRGGDVGLFGEHSTSAFSFGDMGGSRWIGPAPTIRKYLADGKLLLRPKIIRATAHWAAHLLGYAQVGRQDNLAGYGAYHRDQAEREIFSTTAELDINADGQGEIFVNMGAVNTLFT